MLTSRIINFGNDTFKSIHENRLPLLYVHRQFSWCNDESLEFILLIKFFEIFWPRTLYYSLQLPNYTFLRTGSTVFTVSEFNRYFRFGRDTYQPTGKYHTKPVMNSDIHLLIVCFTFDDNNTLKMPVSRLILYGWKNKCLYFNQYLVLFISITTILFR